MKGETGRRSDDVEINLWGIKLFGPVRALITLLSGTATILALVTLLAYHTIQDIKYNEQVIVMMGQIKGAMDLQNGILILPQSERGSLAHRLPMETQRNLGMVEGR